MEECGNYFGVEEAMELVMQVGNVMGHWVDQKN
jgi:hypothetical protein